MTGLQKIIKYVATAFAIFLTISIVGGILGIAGIFGGLIGEDGVLDDLKTYSVSNSISKLEVEIAAADFTIQQSDSFSVESNLKNLEVTEKDGVLIITETAKIGVKYTDATLTLNIPYKSVFEEADITTGAGRLKVDVLAADSLKFEFGAGEVNIKSLTANNKVKINGGAGKITISDSNLHNLDLDMGVGQLNMIASLYGDNDLDLGVGESNLTFIGQEDDYSVDIEKGIGSLSVNGNQVSNYNSTHGITEVDIDGGVGAINLIFKTE